MSKLTLDAKEAAALVERLWGGALTLHDGGATLALPSLNLNVEARKFAFEGIVTAGKLKLDVQSVALTQRGVDVDFGIV